MQNIWKLSLFLRRIILCLVDWPIYYSFGNISKLIYHTTKQYQNRSQLGMILYQYLIFVSGPSNWFFPKLLYIFFNYRTFHHPLQVQKKMHSNFIGIDIVWNENEKCQKHFHLIFIKMHHRFQNGFSFEHQIIDCWDS